MKKYLVKVRVDGETAVDFFTRDEIARIVNSNKRDRFLEALAVFDMNEDTMKDPFRVEIDELMGLPA